MVVRYFLLASGAPMRIINDGVVSDLPPSPGHCVCMLDETGKYNVSGVVTDVAPAGEANCSYVRASNDAYYIPTGSTPINPKLSVERAFCVAIRVTVKFDSPSANDHIVSVFDVNVRLSKAMDA